MNTVSTRWSDLRYYNDTEIRAQVSRVSGVYVLYSHEPLQSGEAVVIPLYVG